MDRGAWQAIVGGVFSALSLGEVTKGMVAASH